MLSGRLVVCSTSRDARLVYTEVGKRLCNVAINTFYLRLYGVGRMAKDHGDTHHPIHRITHNMGFFLHKSWNIGWNEK